MASIENTVFELAKPIAEELGLKIWDVRFVKEGADYFLRIFIDKEGGVLIDDCVDMSHAIDGPLDEADPIDKSYCLEVSSPGAERPLTRDEHFKVYKGEKIQVKFIRAVDGQREYKGVLKDYEKGNVTLEIEDEKQIVFNKKEASYIKADDLSDYF
ncbi:MAG: ribosome maturation factor RimP [Ruminococcaceae bacterium]|nr:ribosome maturation factor RimP [Oscillospiraceae bacterium]